MLNVTVPIPSIPVLIVIGIAVATSIGLLCALFRAKKEGTSLCNCSLWWVVPISISSLIIAIFPIVYRIGNNNYYTSPPEWQKFYNNINSIGLDPKTRSIYIDNCLADFEKRDIPLGKRDIPLGKRDIPLEKRNIPLQTYRLISPFLNDAQKEKLIPLVKLPPVVELPNVQ